MATQTRRTTGRSARSFRAIGKASMVTACCGLILLSAVAAHAGAYSNGIPYNGMGLNGMPFQGLILNGTPYNGIPWNGIGPNGIPFNGVPIQGMPHNGLPYNGYPIQGMPMQGMPHNDLPTQEGALPTVQSEHLPWSTLSQRPLGTTPPSRLGFLSPCSRYRLGPLCL
jgi:hypothetical protein